MSLSRASAREDAWFASVLPRSVRNSPTVGRRSSRAVPCLATVPPRDGNAKGDVKTAKCSRHYPIVPGRRSENRESTSEHKADPHKRNDSDRERTARHDSSSIQKQPHARNRRDNTRAIKDNREESADEHWRRKAENEFATRSREQRHVRSSCLLDDCPKQDARREHGRRHPDVDRP